MNIIIVNLLLFVLACLVMVFSGSLVVKSLLRIAVWMRLSEFVVAFLLMAVGTSLPELFVGITASLQNNSSLALGNAFGAVVMDLTFVMGVALLLSRKMVVQDDIRHDALLMFFVAALPVVLLLLGGSLSRLDGAILVLSFFGYALHLMKHKRNFSHIVHDGSSPWLWTVCSFVLGLVLLVASAHFVVVFGSSLSVALGLPEIIIGLVFISIGTTLPELVFEARAAMSRHPELSLGDSVGSVVVNSTLVIGVASLISPISVEISSFIMTGLFLLFFALMLALILQYKRLSWRHGILLLLFYIIFLITELSLKGVL